MGKRWITLILVGSIMGEEAAGEICKHGPYRLPITRTRNAPKLMLVLTAGQYRLTPALLRRQPQAHLSCYSVLAASCQS